MAIARSGTPSQAGFAAGTSIVVTLPTGLTAGDILLLNFNTQAAGNSATIAASGWTRHAASGESSGGAQNWLFWKVYAAGDPATVTVANSVSSNGGYQSGGWSGVDTTTPLGTASVSTNASSTTLNVASLTTTKSGSYGIVCCGTGSGSVTFNTLPSGYTSVATNSGNKNGNLSDQSFPSPTTTGALSYTLSATAVGTSIQVELFAAPAAGGFVPSTMLPLTGLQLPGSPTVAPPIGPTQGPDPSTFDIVTPLPIAQFVHPLSLVLAAQLFPAVQPLVAPPAGVIQLLTATASGSSTVTATIVKTAVLNPVVNGVSTVSATIVKTAVVKPAVNGVTTISVSVVKTAVLKPTVNGLTTVTGSVVGLKVFTVLVNGVTTVSASVAGGGGQPPVSNTLSVDANRVQHLIAEVR